MRFTYDALPGRVVFAPGARHGLAAELDRLALGRVMVIAGPLERSIADEVAAGIGDRAVGLFDDVVQHVPVERAEAARAHAKDLDADGVVTIGGGSATGLGKAVVVDVPVPLVALPTTYAGSEATDIYGLTDGDDKRTARDVRAKPTLAVYDPELTLTLPPAIAGPSGMNALAHCVEALYGPGANPITSLQALEGMRALHHSLPAVCAQPDDLAARSEALYGAYLAGTALAVGGTALHHKTCHVLGGMFDLNHGDMNAVVLPHALRYNQPAIADEFARMSETLGVDDAADALYDLAAAIGAPTSLGSIGMPADGIDAATPRVVAANTENVRPPDAASIRAMLADAYAGRRPVAAAN